MYRGDEGTFSNTCRTKASNNSPSKSWYHSVNAYYDMAENQLLQVVTTGLLVNHIKQRLCTEPSSLGRPDSAVSVSSFLITNSHRLLASRTSSGLSHELTLAALFHREEPENGLQTIRVSKSEPITITQQQLSSNSPLPQFRPQSTTHDSATTQPSSRPNKPQYPSPPSPPTQPH